MAPALMTMPLMVLLDVAAVMVPPVVTFNPPLDEIANVPVLLPIVTLFVPVPRETAPDPLTVNAPDPCE